MAEHLEKSGQFLTDSEHQERLDDKFNCSFLVKLENQIIGTLKYAKYETTIEIMQIQVHPKHQNKGYGSGIIKQVLQSAQSKTISLTVLKNNPAVRLYHRLGFKTVGEDTYEYHMQIKH